MVYFYSLVAGKNIGLFYKSFRNFGVQCRTLGDFANEKVPRNFLTWQGCEQSFHTTSNRQGSADFKTCDESPKDLNYYPYSKESTEIKSQVIVVTSSESQSRISASWHALRSTSLGLRWLRRRSL